MRRSHLLPSAAFALLLPLAAAAQPTERVATFPGWVDGGVYEVTTHMAMPQTMEMRVAGQTQTRRTSNEMRTAQTLHPVRTRGGWEVSMRTDRMHSTSTSSMAPEAVVIDSDNLDAVPEAQREALRALVGATLVARFDPAFALLGIAPADAVTTPELAAMVENTSAMFAFPRQPMAPGETWETTGQTTMLGLPMTVASRYTLARVADDSLHFDVHTTYEADGPVATPQSPVPMTARMTMRGEGPSTYAVHRRNGGSFSTGRYTMAGQMTMMADALPEPMVTDMRTDAVSSSATRLRD